MSKSRSKRERIKRKMRQANCAQSAIVSNKDESFLWAGCIAATVCASGLPLSVSYAVDLPTPCIAGSCGAGAPTTWITSGKATATFTGSTLTVNQSSDRAVLNWRNFNISSDGTVEFKQPDASAVALNRIFQADPARIFGTLKANGTIYLINQNGILFGPNARVNVGGLIASSLDVTPDAMDSLLQAAANKRPAFQRFSDADGNALVSGDVKVAAGAEISSNGGSILLLAPNVANEGTLKSPDGQVILAAGESIFLAPSFEPSLRGLLVEVANGGTTANSVAGLINADRGNVTMAGLVVNQAGRVTASTSVRQNGSVRLLARDGGGVSSNGRDLLATNGGTLTLGAGSTIEVSLDLASKDTAVDATAQTPSFVELDGRTVSLESGSKIVAPAGNVSIAARANPQTQSADFTPAPGPGRLVVAPGATVDVAGAAIDLPMESNVLRVELRGSQLADSPMQRNDLLRGQTIYVDVRRTGARSDGSTWVGSPIGDLSGDIATITKTVGQRSLAGGNITLASDGLIALDANSVLDVAGGRIAYQSGFVSTSKVIDSTGRVYDIANADPNQEYHGLTRGYTLDHPKWGIVETFPSYLLSTLGGYEQGYVEGKDAGTISVVAPRIVLDGSLRGSTVVGPNQRQAPTSLSVGALYRPINQMPLGGSLVLGSVSGRVFNGLPNFVLPEVQVGSGSTSLPYDPFIEQLPSALDTIYIRPDLFNANGMSRFAIYSNDRIEFQEGTSIMLPPSGSVTLKAGAIELAGNISSLGGSLTAGVLSTTTLSPDSGRSILQLSAGASIDVSGSWVNDLPTSKEPASRVPLILNGGAVSLTSQDGALLDLQDGSSINVSGGAYRSSSGAIVAGRGGSVAIRAGAGLEAATVETHVRADFQGYALSQGGQIAITANSVCLAALDCSDDSVGRVWADVNGLAQHGFANISFTSNIGGIEVLPETQIRPRLVNSNLMRGSTLLPSGSPLSSALLFETLPDLIRKPVNLSLTAQPQLSGGAPVTAATFSDLGILTVGTRAAIDLDPGASLLLQSSSSISVAGRLSAPAGNISLKLTTELPLELEFLPNQSIWLEDTAQLMATGAVRTFLDDRGLFVGSVDAGGSISLSAARGYVVTSRGSLLDVSGTQAEVALGNVTPGLPLELTHVASSGGSINVAAAEGMLLYGQLNANPGQGAGAGGGSLSVTLDGNLHGDEPISAPSPIFPLGARELHLISGSVPAIASANHLIPVSFNGRAVVPQQRIADGGFSTINLVVTNLYDAKSPGGNNTPVSTGSIVFDDSMLLRADAQLRLNTPRLAAAPDAHVQLESSYVALGYDDLTAGAQTGNIASDGTAVLEVRGNLVDMIGSMGFAGFGNSTLHSAGDIRLVGVQSRSSGDTMPILGSLRAAGLLTLEAQQIYPTTLTKFDVIVDGAEASGGAKDDTINIVGVPGQPSTVLSAGSTLALTADNVVQRGVLRAPFGQIEIKADTLTLAAGSSTSTSGAGVLVPFGTIQAGRDWTYQLPLGQTSVFTTSGPPTQRITLNSNNLVASSGAQLDISGGGDLQAFEFTPGVTGTQNILANSFVSGQFAIAPFARLPFGAYDPNAQLGFSYSIGTNIHLSGVDGLPEGDYAVLPASYALLPGAYLIRPASGYRDLLPSETLRQLDGSAVVSGYFTRAGTNIRDSRTSGFKVYSHEQIGGFARYELANANAFFTSLDRLGDADIPRLPRDSGQLQLIAGLGFDFAGRLSANAAAGGRGSIVDVSATRLQVINDDSSVLPSFVPINAHQLSALGAESLLLGGLRNTIDGEVHVDTRADQLVVSERVELSGPSVALVAQNQLSIATGAELRATGAAVAPSPTLQLTGSGAMVQVSTGPQADVVRTDTTASGGALSIASGAKIGGKGSALIEASGSISAAPSYDLQGGALAFFVSRLAVGEPPQTSYSGMVIRPDELSSLGLSELLLASRSDIDFFGTTALNVTGNLELRAQRLLAADTLAAVDLHATSVLLTGLKENLTVTTIQAGDLRIGGDRIGFGGGSLGIRGFGTTSLTATSLFAGDAAGGLSIIGNATINAPLLSLADNASVSINATGALGILGGSTTSAASIAGVGGRFDLVGKSIDVDSAIRVPSGVVSLTSSGTTGSSVTLRSNAVIDVAGFETSFDGQSLSSPGGFVTLASDQGDVKIADGAIIDVSSVGARGRAGRLDIRAAQGDVAIEGEVRALNADGVVGGELNVDAQRLPDLAALNANLNRNGFSSARSFRQRGSGNLVLSGAPDGTVRANSVTLSADGGAVQIVGDIDASGPSGGTVRLTARDAVSVTGKVKADALDANGDGGSVDLWSDQGGVIVSGSGRVSVAGGSHGMGGTVRMRVPRAALLTVIDGDSQNDNVAFGANILGASALTVEGYQRYTLNGGLINSASQVGATSNNPWFDDARAFMQNESAIEAALSSDRDLLRVLPGVEIEAPANIALQTVDWNLYLWRFNGEPGVLTLRAPGNLTFNRSLSDGFETVTVAGAASSVAKAFALPETPSQSWSYRLIAGADLSASNVLATKVATSNGAATGNLIVAAGTVSSTPALGAGTAPVPVMIRTGTGDIDLAAAGNFTLTNRASVVYTAGMNSQTGIPLTPLSSQLATYPFQGGDIRVSTGGSISGAVTNQLVTGWLWRTGQAVGETSPTPAGWNVNFQRFEQGIGALAGGDVTVRAGSNISDLSVSIATIGKQVGGTTAETSNVDVTGGGTLQVESVGAITGGSYFVGRGSGVLHSWDRVGASSGATPVSVLAPTLALADATLDVIARGDTTIETIVNPFLLPQGKAQNVSRSTASYFSTYGDSSAVQLTSVAGDVTLTNDVQRTGGLVSSLSSMSWASTTQSNPIASLRVYPGSLTAVALNGDISDHGNFFLWPSSSGNLQLLAHDDVDLSLGAVFMSDADPARISSFALPRNTLKELATAIAIPIPGTARVPIHSAAFRSDALDDPEPVRIVAKTGDVIQANLSNIPKPLRLIAGHDIVNLQANIQNVGPGSLSLISAGHDITYATQRLSTTGALAISNVGIQVSGPGRLALQAGHNVDLGTSNGITSTGNLTNPALPDVGADISVLVGTTKDQINLSAFEQRYLVDTATYDDTLLKFIQSRVNKAIDSKADALAALASLGLDSRYELAEAIMFAELRAGGRTAAAAGPAHGDYTRAFNAIDTLFPGSTANAGSNGKNAYDGDLSLFFSRIYTLAGGSIFMNAPGGDVNVGLATPPVAYGITKPASQLGIVAQQSGSIESASQGDFLVNESRVFAADGGDILVWSNVGDIDAGRGAKTAISAPPPTITFDSNGNIQTIFPAALTGSGIQALATTKGRDAGNVDLFAPRGVVNAGDAGIVAGNLTIGATAVLGADNIKVSGVSVGVPVDAGGLGSSLAFVSSTASSTTNAANMAGDANANKKDEQKAPLADTALSWLEVFVIGLGEESCKQDDVECLKRQK